MEVKIEKVTKKLKGTEVLKDINLTLESGKVYGFIGKNGSGKTMLLRLVAGLLRPTEGKVYVNGQDIYSMKGILPDIGIIIENVGVYPEFTGFKNLKMLAKIKNKIKDSDIEEAILRVGLDPYDKRIVKKYSLGMRQKIVIAQAIMERPDILVLDEPTNALDDSGIELFRKIIKEEKERGAVILMASHNKEDIAVLCDDIYQIKGGELSKQTERREEVEC